MKHKLKIFDTEATTIPERMGMREEMNDALFGELAVAIFKDSITDNDRKIEDVLIEALDQAEISWSPETPNDYFMIGFIFASARTMLREMKAGLQKKNPLLDLLRG